MKKIILTLFLGLFMFTSKASAELGINVGISGQLGLYAATATEFDEGTNGTTTGPDETNKESEFLGLGYGSVFLEKTLGKYFLVGIDYVPAALETETSESIRNDITTGGASSFTAQTNKVQVDFEDLTTYYLGLNLGDSGAYAKVGIVKVDVITNESLGTGSTYGNTDLDGTLFGLGYHKGFDNGFFVRGEGTYTEFDGASLTSSTSVNKITLNSLDGVTGKISIGKSF
jgi:hypothetical protein